MTIRVDTLGIQISLTRLINRTGSGKTTATSPWRQVDLTPLLGTAGSIRTIKDIHTAVGGFSVTFADRMHPEFKEMVAALVRGHAVSA